MRTELGAEVGIGDDEELPGLKAVRGWRKNERVLERLPHVGRDFFGSVELFGGVAPGLCSEELISGNRIHATRMGMPRALDIK